MLALKIFLAKLMPQYRVVQSAKSNMGTLKVRDLEMKLRNLTTLC